MYTPRPALLLNLDYFHKTAPTLNHLGKPSGWYISRLNRFFYNLEETVMPSKNKRTGTLKGLPDITFVQYRLNSQEKKDFAKWKEAEEISSGLAFVEFVQSGMKCSISWDSNNDCYIASATCKDEGSSNHNMCLTSRANDWYEATLMNVYKTTVLCEGGLWADLDQEADLG
jgi:hypothetical protein